VDLLLLRATSPLGHPFLSDGKLALLLVRLMLLK
jgi:hypothetical protein